MSQNYKLTFTMLDGRTIVKTQYVEVTPGASHGPPACGEIVWRGTVPSDGQVTINWEHGESKSQPETGSIVTGVIPPHSGVKLSAVEPWVTVVAQPATLKRVVMRFQSSHTGPVAIHFFWQQVGTN